MVQGDVQPGTAGTGSEGAGTGTGTGGLRRWLEPGPPRVVAAVLLLVAMVVGFVATGFGAVQVSAYSGTSSALLLTVLPAVTSLASSLAVAAFVLLGSPAARVLGSLVATGGLAMLVLPALLSGLPGGAAVVVYGAVAAVHVGTVVALAVPLGPRPGQ